MNIRDVVACRETWAHEMVEATCRKYDIPIDRGQIDLIVFKAVQAIEGRKTNDKILVNLRQELRMWAKAHRAGIRRTP